MPKLYSDLHMHSILSPCGDELMTPNNIVNMAELKGLDVIAVTDHNCAKNLPAVFDVANETGMLVLPGMEVTIMEEAHVLCYFKSLETCLAYSDEVYDRLMNIPNNPKIYGEQLILDEEDEIVGHIDKLLISATTISLEEMCKRVTDLDGAVVPAHVNKKSYSVLESLGIIPPEMSIRTLEVSRHVNILEFARTQFFGDYTYITSSDAHYLEDMYERVTTIEPKEKSLDSIVEYLKHGA